MAPRPPQAISDHGQYAPVTVAGEKLLSASWDSKVILELYEESEFADVVLKARDFSNGT
jgi:hypothetical protein